MTRKRKMRSTAAWALAAALPLMVSVAAGEVRAQVPGRHWQMYETPEQAGWSAAKLAEAESLYARSGAAAVVVVYDGRILAAWGEVSRRFMCHSVRKSFLSALYGVYVDRGMIDLDATLSDLGIDDISPLTDAEKQATVRELLKARSGVYHSAAYESAAMKKRRPRRGSHPHGTFWYYNNWDFNVLGAIFEQKTGEDIFSAFDRSIAAPTQMEHYRLMDGYHHLEAEFSRYPAYPFKMSALDMARFGLLFMREGDWNGKAVIPRRWVLESTTSYSPNDRGGYAYLWWTDVPEGRPHRYFALGYGGHVIGVCPEEKIVFVQRVDTYRGKSVGLPEALAVLDAVAAAKVSPPKANPALATFEPPEHRVPTVRLGREKLERYAKTYPARNGTAVVRVIGDALLLESPFYGKFRLLPLSEKLFFVEDMQYYAVFDFAGGVPQNVTLHATRGIADFYGDITSEGAAEAIRRYRRTVAEGRRAFGEFELGELGYQLAGTGRTRESIAVFELNASDHPASAGAWDSLAEGYLVAGNEEAAIRCYRKSLELDPNNGNAEQKLEQLGASAQR
jgi:CubicO group peptidase (beta-lactamase class C family)